MDDCEDLLPEYLRFVKGVVDSDDLPLNVSREMLQQQSVVTKLRTQLVKRILDHLARLAGGEAAERDTFAKIEAQFGAIWREGLVNDPPHREQLTRLVRFPSTWTVTQERAPGRPAPTTGLAEYRTRMPAGQEAIYYLTAPGLAAAQSSPHLEGYAAKGYEVLFLVEPVDDYLMQYGSLTEFDGVKLVHVGKGEADLIDPQEKKRLAKRTKEFSDFLGWCRENLGADIKEVRLSARLKDSPCCLISDEHSLSPAMADLMRNMGRELPPQTRILELNPDHPLVVALQAGWQDAARRDELAGHLSVLRDQAVLAEGGRLADPAAFARRVQTLMGKVLG
jgi:molecular chaperone HtpG